MARRINPDDLVGAHEIADRLGLAFPNLVHTWRRRHPDFPKPVAELQAGVIWDWTEIEKWLISTGRTVARGDE